MGRGTDVFGLVLLTACTTSAPEVARADVDRVVDVLVAARVEQAGQPAAWTAQLRMGPPPTSEPVVPGCRPWQPPADEPGEQGAVEVRITGPAGARLVWDPARGLWATGGPRRAVDPAWVVGDVQWREPDGRLRVAESAVRFGAMPVVTQVARDDEGAVQLRWDPATVEAVEVHVDGPGGPLVCTGDDGGVDLPWWAVPPSGGTVILRSTGERLMLLDGEVGVRARSTLEVRVPLDRPGTSAVEELPPRRGTPSTPRRYGRTARNITG